MLGDGDVLHWVVEMVPGSAPQVIYFRTDRGGSLTSAIGWTLLRQHAHPDADLLQPVDDGLARLGREAS